MRRQLSYCCDIPDDGAREQLAARVNPLPRARWRAVLDLMVGAPLRLHRYRHMHAEVIEDALEAFDCGPRRREWR